MTERLYYQDSFLYNFDAEVRSVIETPRPALTLDRTAFYPTSGGQIHDTGTIVPADARFSDASFSEARFRVTEVADTEDGHIVHYLDAPLKDALLKKVQPGTRVRGEIDAARRRDHMQQHSAQHVLSSAFVRLFGMATVSFHMADDYCSIDLDTASLSKDQVESAERRANEIMIEDRAVDVRYVTRDEAEKLGLRKLPPAERDQLRLIDIRDWDVTACGGTHVSRTGQIGGILLRKTEKVRQGYRVEFVAGQRAVATARRDFSTLTETAALFSAG
ncbi:MAG: alanyl-tRNA editing protein, partial [Candidatus Sulfotelmatobacter sp.]